MDNPFFNSILNLLTQRFGDTANVVFEGSALLQYISLKTRSVNKGSKNRSSFANLYAIYVLIEDYLDQGFDKCSDYSAYSGASFNKLFIRQRELPFGGKLQNHALNNRLNAEFKKYFPTKDFIPILRNLKTNKYWINENLLKLSIGEQTINIAECVIEIINEYIYQKQISFKNFINTCSELQSINEKDYHKGQEFVTGLLEPNVDARIFEIVSFSILKNFYSDTSIIWGYDYDNLRIDYLQLFKTGRANANDGGIDFVMKPLGRFFQVTESLDFKKYFLDIDKIQKYPITFVIKSIEDIEILKSRIKENAQRSYSIQAVVDTYLSCIEEIINIPMLKDMLNYVINNARFSEILNDILIQSKLEFNLL
jgi:hypothetical protein